MISAVVITFNEEKNIRDCFESIKWVDEIIVVDANSTDKTVSICKEYTDKIFVKEWDGYSAQKNFGIEKAKGDWILSIDADERVTEKLKNEIISTSKSSEFDGYYIPRKAFFLDRWINHCGWYPDYQLRLFKKEKARFNKRDVHEGVELEPKAKIGYLKNDLLHYPYGDLAHYFEKFNEYTNLSSYELHKRNKKFHWYNLFMNPFLFFIKSYFLRLGFLDGLAGFAICAISSFNTLVKYAKLWESEKNKEYTSG